MGTCSPRFGNKQRSIIYFIYSYIFIFDLLREGCPSLKLFFKGPFQVPFLFSENVPIFLKEMNALEVLCPPPMLELLPTSLYSLQGMASRTGARLFTCVTKFLFRLVHTI